MPRAYKYFNLTLILIVFCLSKTIGQEDFIKLIQKGDSLYTNNQLRSADTLFKKLLVLSKAKKDDSTSLILLDKILHISYNLGFGNMDLELLDEGIALSRKINNEPILTRLISNKAGQYYQMGEYKTATSLYEEATELLDTTDVELPKLLARLGSGYAYIEEHKEKSDSVFNKALYYAHSIGDSLAISIVNESFGTTRYKKQKLYDATINMLASLDYLPQSKIYNLRRFSGAKSLGNIYYYLEDYVQAEKYYNMALDIALTNKYKRSIGDTYMGLANIASVKTEYIKAHQLNHQAYKLLKNSRNNNSKYACLTGLAASFLDMGDLDSSAIILNQIDSKAIQKVNQSIRAKYHATYGYLFSSKNQYNKAIGEFRKSYDLAKSINDHYYMKIGLIGLSESYNALGNDKLAFKYYREYDFVEDSIFRSNKNNQVRQLEAQYQNEKKENEIALLDERNNLQSIQLSNQNRIIVIGAIGLALLSLLSFFLYKVYQKLKSSNHLLSISIDEKNLLLREIHHRVKNNLQIVSSLLSLQSRFIEDDTALEAIKEGRNRVSSMALLHQNLYQENNLTGIDIKIYFDELIEGLFDSYNIDTERISLTKNITNMALDVDTVIPLGLVVNELISNALKHAFPGEKKGKIHISLHEKDSNLVLEVKDNGIGVNAEDFNNSTSFGNRMLRAFAQKMGAEMEIENNKGTKVILKIEKYKKAA